MPTYRRPARARAVHKLSGVQTKVILVENRQHFEKLLKKGPNRIVLVHFGASWSAPYKKVQRIISDLSGRAEFSNVIFAEVDVERLQELANRANVQQLPTCCVYVNGELKASLSGENAMEIYEVLRKNAMQVREIAPVQPDTRNRWQRLVQNPFVMLPTLTVLVIGAAAGIGA